MPSACSSEMIDFQSIPSLYRNADVFASGIPISGNPTLGNMRSEYGNRLHQARKRAHMTQAALCKAVGISQSTLSELEHDAQGSSHTATLARALNVRAEWLATGELPMQISNVEPGPSLRGVVPLISWVQAGQWTGAIDPLQPGEAEAWLSCPRSHSPSTYALRVRGDSMTAQHGKTYPDGSVIFVDPEKRTPVNGDRIVAKLEGSDDVTFKVYKNEDGRQWLQPLNPSHEPIRDEFKVLGTVIGKWEDE